MEGEASPQEGSTQPQASAPSPDVAVGTYSKVSGFAVCHGQDYELRLAALVFLRGLKSGQHFQLATNVQGAGALDDLVFRFKSQQGAAWTTTFVQLKHKDNSRIRRNMLTNPKGDFSIQKYFKSYLEIKQAMSTTGSRAVLFDGDFEDCQFVLYTNAKADAQLVGGRSGDFSQAETFLGTQSGSVFSFEEDKEMLASLGEQGGDQGKEFLKRFRVFCGQPGVDDLKAVVKEEIAKLDRKQILGLNIERLCDCYLGNVKAWCEKRAKNVILDKDHNMLQNTFSKVWLESCSEQMLKESVLNLDFDDTALLKLSNGVALVVSSEPSCRLTLTKLVQSTQGQSLVLNCEQLLVNNQALLSECKNKDKKRLIVLAKDCRLDRCKEYFLVINDIAKREDFSVVFLIDGNDSLDSELRERFPDECESYKDDFKMSQLKPATRGEILNKVVNFQGYDITLGKLLINNHEYFEQVLTAPLIVDIFKSVGPLTLGQALPEGISYYVERTLEQALCVKSSVFQALQGTVIVQIEPSEASDMGLFAKALDFVNSLKDNSSFNQLDKEDIVDKLVKSPLVPDKKNSGVFISSKLKLGIYECRCIGLRFGAKDAVTALLVRRSVRASLYASFLFVSKDTEASDVTKLSELQQAKHLLSLKDGELRWVQSHGDMESIRKHADESKPSYFAPDTVMDVQDRLLLVCAEPGMGKSTLMARLAKNTKEALPHYFVILIALNDHSKLFVERIDKDRQVYEDALEFLSIAAKMNSPLQKSLLKFALEVSGNVVLILDGFDEIAPKFVEQTCHFLSSIRTKTKASKIWMSSRNSVKHFLEKHFAKFSVKFSEFDTVKQKEFLRKYWAGKASEENLNEFIVKILEKSARAIGEKERNFLGIPLQARMLAEVFENHVTDSIETIELPDKLDLLYLVEQFIEKKLKNYCQDKLKIAPHISNEETVLSKFKNDFVASHTNAALILVFGDDDMKSLGLGRILGESSTLFNDNIHRDAYETGFIDEIVNDKPHFIHHVFAEYLVAHWISQHFTGNLEFVQSKMFTPDFTVIRYFFNGILSKGFVLHTAVLQENVEQVKTLLESEDVEAQDVGGRTALHLAASLGASEDQEEDRRRCEILDLIIGKTGDFKVVDKVLCGSPLRYADISRSWSAIDKLLCKTDDNGQLVLTLGNVSDDNMLDTIFEQDLDNLLELCLENDLAVEYGCRNRHNGVIRLLVKACKEGSFKLATLLIKRNANINRTESDKQAVMSQGPLIAASFNGHLKIVKLLVAEYVSNPSCSCLRKVFCCSTCHSDASKYINKKDCLGRTAIHCAASQGHAEVINFLVTQGGDPRSRDDRKMTPMHWAAKSNQPSTLSVLLETLSDKESPGAIRSFDNEKDNIWHHAARGGSVDKKRAGAIKSFDKEGDNALHHASRAGSVECVTLLYEAGWKMTKVNKKRETPLMIAASEGRHQVVKWLMENFNDDREGITLVDYIKMQDKDGKTALEMAQNVECRRVIETFITQSVVASPNIGSLR